MNFPGNVQAVIIRENIVHLGMHILERGKVYLAHRCNVGRVETQIMVGRKQYSRSSMGRGERRLRRGMRNRVQYMYLLNSTVLLGTGFALCKADQTTEF